jgi:hypothetical protein
MKKIAIIIFGLLFIGCAIGPTHGLLYTNNKFAGDYNPANDVQGSKSAESCQHNILNLVAVGNSGVGELAMNNNIKRIATIDHSTLSILTLLYANHCTIITGD